MDRSIGRDGRGRARGWVMDDERRGPSRWMTIDRGRSMGGGRSRRSIASIRAVAIDARGSTRSTRRSDRHRHRRLQTGRGSRDVVGPIAGRRRLSGRRRRDARTGGGGRARGEWTNDAWRGVGRGRVRSGGGGRRRARERDAARDRGRAGRAKAGRMTDEGCFLNFCARV